MLQLERCGLVPGDSSVFGALHDLEDHHGLGWLTTACSFNSKGSDTLFLNFGDTDPHVHICTNSYRDTIKNKSYKRGGSKAGGQFSMSPFPHLINGSARET